jgi:hypothetical protein
VTLTVQNGTLNVEGKVMEITWRWEHNVRGRERVLPRRDAQRSVENTFGGAASELASAGWRSRISSAKSYICCGIPLVPDTIIGEVDAGLKKGIDVPGGPPRANGHDVLYTTPCSSVASFKRESSLYAWLNRM